MRRAEQYDEDQLAARVSRARERAQDPTPTPWRAADVRARLAALKRRGRPWLGITLAIALFAAPFVVPSFVPGVTSRGAL